MRNAGVWSGSIILVFASVIFYQALSLDYSTPLGPGPGFFPRWLGGLLAILAVAYIWDSMKNEVITISEMLPEGKALGNIAATLLGMVLFLAVVTYTGFVAAGTMLLFIMFVREYKWYTAFGVSFGISLLLLIVFQSILGVSLPVNEFGW